MENETRSKWYFSGLLAVLAASSVAWAQAPQVTAPPQPGAWLSADQRALQDFRQRLAEQPQSRRQAWLPVIEEFNTLIESDPELFMLFTQMFEQIPRTAPYLNDPVGNPQLRNYREMLEVMNRVLTQAPEFNRTDLVGFPINAIVNWAMGTPAGAAAFLNDKVNRQLKKILN